MIHPFAHALSEDADDFGGDRRIRIESVAKRLAIETQDADALRPSAQCCGTRGGIEHGQLPKQSPGLCGTHNSLIKAFSLQDYHLSGKHDKHLIPRLAFMTETFCR
jgi:hypothetical protein